MRNIYKFSIVVLALGLGLMACQKDSLVTDVPHNQDPDLNWGVEIPTPIVAPFYFKGKIDSTLYTLQDSIDGFYNLVFDSGYAACNGSDVFYGQLTGMYSLGGVHTLEVKFLKCIEDSTNLADKSSLMYLGTFPYGNSNYLAGVDGVEVSWIDDNNKVWKSLPGSGAKNDDSFQVLTIGPAPGNVLGNLLISGKMDITLYNATESIKIESGEFEFQYGVY